MKIEIYKDYYLFIVYSDGCIWFFFFSKVRIEGLCVMGDLDEEIGFWKEVNEGFILVDSLDKLNV